MAARIRPNRQEVSRQFPILGFSVRTDPDRPYFEVALATDPSLFDAGAHDRRTPSTFYSSRAEGAKPGGDVVYLVPPPVMARFVGKDRLYYALATYAAPGFHDPRVETVSDGARPYVTVSQTFRGEVRGITGVPNRQGGLTGGDGYADVSNAALTWGGDEDEARDRVNASSLPIDGPVERLDDETIEQQLVPAARTALATNRQQLLATMVMMGINRIVVTDGTIKAKVMYDFRAQDVYQRKTTATEFDYGDQYVTSGEGTFDYGREEADVEVSKSGRRRKRNVEVSRTGGKSWAQGEYKYKRQPVLELMSVTNEVQGGSLQTRAQLAGEVEVNFKSDHIPLEKMADNYQLGIIQRAAEPGQGGRGVPPAQRPGTNPPSNGAP